MTNRAYSRAGIVARLFNQPLAVLPQTAAIVLGAIGPRLDVAQMFVQTEGRSLGIAELEQLAAGRRIELEAQGNTSAQGGIDRRAKAAPAAKLMFVNAGVAHIGVRGETVAENDGSIGPMSGFTGYDGLVAQVQSADADPGVRGILLDIDSPGGEVSGLFEACAILMARRGTKPMRAMIRNVGASAAYAIAACADPGQITLHELGMAGSIGCMTMHADFSGSLEQDGVKVTLFGSGSHKTDGNPFQPLSADVVARVQAMVDTSADRFIAHVAAARGMTPDAVRAQQAQVYMGEEAVAAGLVDKIMSWQDSMDEFEAVVNGAGSRSAGAAPSGVTAKGPNMDPNAQSPAADQQPVLTQSAHEAALATARTEASAQATTAERERISALAEIDPGTTLSAGFTDALTAGTSAGDFAIGLARAGKEKTAAALGNLKTDAVQPGQLPAADAATAAGGAAPKVNRGQAAVERNRGKVPGLPAKA